MLCADETGTARPLRLFLLGALALFLLLVVLLTLAIPAVIAVRQRLDDGRLAMQEARSAVLGGQPREALRRFRAAQVSFGEAEAQAVSGILGLVRHVPVLGSNVVVVRSLASAGDRTAQAGIGIAGAVEQIPGGVDGLAPSNGRIPIERLPALATAVEHAHELVVGALRDVRSSGGEGLVPPVADARSQAESSLDGLDSTLGAAAGMLDGLPAFLGADGPRTYLFGAENPAELRGTGGLVGAYALLRVEDGRLSFSAFRPIQTLPLLDPDSVEAPNPDYHRLYDPQRTGNGFWLNANMTPDFPSAAQAFETGFEAVTGRQIDGVVTADPFALRALLESTGPVTVPRLGVRVSADTVVSLLTNRAYAEIQNPAERKLVLGAVAETVVERFLGSEPGAEAVRSVGQAAGEGHIKLYADDPDLEDSLSQTTAGGAFRPMAPGATDVLSVVVNNGAANKVDYYVDRTVRYDVTLEGDGSASARTEVHIANHAPDGGLPTYVLGPKPGVTDRAGQDISILNVYCGRCDVRRASRGGTPFDPGLDHEEGSNLAQDYFTTDSGATTTSTFDYELERTWSGDAAGGTYTLRFLNQPTIRPTRLEVTIHVPDGMSVTDASTGVSVDGSVATWSGVPERSLEVRVSFAPPLPQRLWHTVFG
jgi:hypothetical protein